MEKSKNDIAAPTTLLMASNAIELAQKHYGELSMTPNYQLTGSFTSTIQSRAEKVDRVSCIGDKVDCYRNINKPEIFSIRQQAGENKDKVTGYSKVVLLKNPSIKLSENSRQRVLKEKRKNVHAFVRGNLLGIANALTPEQAEMATARISYSPYRGMHFFDRNTGESVTGPLPTYAVLYGADVYLFNEEAFERCMQHMSHG
jgi:hypothetical protein